MLKVYKSATGVKYNFILNKKDGTQVTISFKGTVKTFQTKDSELQKLIENHRYFTEKKIFLLEMIEAKKAEGLKSDPVDYPDVIDIQGAIVVLVNHYGKKEAALKNPDVVKKAAAEVGATFSNLSF